MYNNLGINKSGRRCFTSVKLKLTTSEKNELRRNKIKLNDISVFEPIYLSDLLDMSLDRAEKIIASAQFQQIPSIGPAFKAEAKKLILRLKTSPSAMNALLFNSFVLGINNYFKRATKANLEFSRLAYDLGAYLYNHLRPVGKYGHPANPPPVYKKFYHRNFKTFKIDEVYLFPLADVKTVNTMGFPQKMTPFTLEGRETVHQKLRPDIQREIGALMKSTLPNRSVEYMDNRISRYSMKMGKCEITGVELSATDVHCHHYVPRSLGGSDQFHNLRVLHWKVHRLIHYKDKEMIDELRPRFHLTWSMIDKINRYREKCKLGPI